MQVFIREVCLSLEVEGFYWGWSLKYIMPVGLTVVADAPVLPEGNQLFNTNDIVRTDYLDKLQWFKASNGQMFI